MTNHRWSHVPAEAPAPGDLHIEGALAIARRETLVLAVATLTRCRDAALLAEIRLRSAIAYAGQFAAASYVGARRHDPRLAAVIASAERWLPDRDSDQLRLADHVSVLLGAFHPTGRLAPVLANETMLIDFDLDDLPLVSLGLNSATLSRISARRARLDATDATGARIHRSSFAAASLRGAKFVDAILADCDLWQANLERAFLGSTRLARCNLAGAVLTDARLPRTCFVECDLLGADIQAPSVAHIDRTWFVSCDLRATDWSGRDLSETTFIKCKLYGVHGAVAGLEHATIVAPDLSPDADGSVIGSKDTVLARWAHGQGSTRLAR